MKKLSENVTEHFVIYTTKAGYKSFVWPNINIGVRNIPDKSVSRYPKAMLAGT